MMGDKELPRELEPVLAEIFALTDLGQSTYYEVVYYVDGRWRSYAGSDTFKDGEQVLRWRYAKECFGLQACAHEFVKTPPHGHRHCRFCNAPYSARAES